MSRPLAPDSLGLTAAGVALVTDAAGAIHRGAVEGLFVDDLRVVSGWTVSCSVPTPLVGRIKLGSSGDRLLFTVTSSTSIDPVGILERKRVVHRCGYAEELRLTAYAQPVRCALRLAVARDDLSVYDVPDTSDAPVTSSLAAGDTPGRFDLSLPTGGSDVSIDAPRWSLAGGHLGVDIDIRPGETWTGSLRVSAGEHQPRSDEPTGADDGLWVSTSPPELATLVESGRADLEALEIPLGNRVIIGAGSPFFLALFGRDSMIAGTQALVAAPRRLVDILAALAALQATAVDELTHAQPGRILHELRLGRAGVFGVPPGTPYYGAVDTAALFVVALGEAMRWGAPRDEIAALVPAARAALEWCRIYGDVDGDGFIESVPHPSGLINQGWKDSGDSVLDADGNTYIGSVALCEVQAYWYRALRAMAELDQFLELGDGTSELAAATALAARFASEFVYDRDGKPYIGLGLNGDKRLLDVATSNAGHVLWSGILPTAVAVPVAEQLAAADLFSGWGVRTLSSAAPGYNPFGYHRGSVWPHDTGFALHGAARYGVASTVGSLSKGLTELGTAIGGQLPELVSGLSRDEAALPVPYAAACRPQAWAAGSPLVVLRACLGLEPDVPAGVVRIHPMLPDGHTIEIERLRLGTHELSISARGRELVDVDSPTLEVVSGPEAVLSSTGWCPISA